MSNILADQIERFIMERFWDAREHEITVQRKEIAAALNCAPSQISYVLSTRFSDEQGFIVESKRGLGGFIRITIIDPVKSGQLGQKENKPEIQSLTLSDIDKLLYLRMREGNITKREAQILHEVFTVIYREPNMDIQNRLVRQMYLRIERLLGGNDYEV